MTRFLKLEIKRVLKSKRFWIAISIGCVIAILHYIITAYNFIGVSEWSLEPINKEEFGDFGTRSPNTWYESWIGGEWYSLFSYVFFMILPLLSVITLGDSLVFDKVSGYSKNLFIRGKRKDYYFARFISSFISGGIVVIVPLFLNILLYCTTLPSLTPEVARGTSPIFADCMWSELFYSHPMVYVVLYLLIILVFSGLFSAFAAAIGSLTENKFLPLVFPFICYLFSYISLASIGLGRYSPFCFLTPAQRVQNITLGVIIAEALLIFIPTAALFVWKSKKDETL